MKRFTALLLVCCIFLNGCAARKDAPQNSADKLVSDSSQTVSSAEQSESEVSSDIDNGFFEQVDGVFESGEYRVENIQIQYLSNEYFEELDYNARENIFFGERLSDLNEKYGSKKYVFTLENGETVTEVFEKFDDRTGEILRNVAIGAGILLVSAVVICAAIEAAPVVVKAVVSLSKNAAVKKFAKEKLSEFAVSLSVKAAQAVTDDADGGSTEESMSDLFKDICEDMIIELGEKAVEKVIVCAFK